MLCGFLQLLIYSFIREVFKKHVIVIPFSNVVLILIYLTLISLVIFFLLKILGEGKLEKKKEEREHKYFQRLNKQYERHVKKRQSHNKTPLNFDIYKNKRAKSNYWAIIMFCVEGIIFLIFAFLVGKGMLVRENIDFLGITLLLIISYFVL